MEFLFIDFQNPITFQIPNQITLNKILLGALASKNQMLHKRFIQERQGFHGGEVIRMCVKNHEVANRYHWVDILLKVKLYI